MSDYLNIEIIASCRIQIAYANCHKICTVSIEGNINLTSYKPYTLLAIKESFIQGFNSKRKLRKCSMSTHINI